MKKLVVFFSLIALMSCEKDDDLLVPHVYSSKTIIENLPPTMGGYVDPNGDLLTFTLPIFDRDNSWEILLTAKVNSISNSGLKQEIYEFGNKAFSYGSWTKRNMANIYGMIPDGVRVDLTGINENQFIMSHNWGNKLYIYSKNNISSIDAENGVISLTKNTLNEVFFITSPVFSGDSYSLTTPSIVYKMDALNTISEFYRFSDLKTYEYSELAGSKSAWYPTDILINITADNNNDIFICFGYDNIIYKLDKTGNLTEFRNDIYCPVSIAFDNQNLPFVLSGPKFSKDGDDSYVMTKSIELYKLSDTEGDELIYTGDEIKAAGKFKLDKNGEYYTISDANYNISINPQNEIYLEDPFRGRVILIK